ncbi:MAG: MopE-related protein, partial [Myxococcota bacterium]|nr:MopE-related protein [Myxococcota bacterium]
MNRRALLSLMGVFVLVGCTSQGVEGETTGESSAVDASVTDVASTTNDANNTFVPADEDVAQASDGTPESPDGLITPETTEPDCEPGTGCFGDPCDDGLDCFSGVCGLHLGDYVCSKLCDATCPDGWECRLSGTGADAYSVCVSRFTHLCQPCGSQADCSSDTKQNACVAYGTDGSEGSFCGGACDDDAPCPAGYLCEQVSVQGGGVSDQCVPESGECACSGVAISLSMGTECSVSNDLGTCSGVRSCGPSGLSPCDALIPGDELCDGVDDDCDGQIDEGFEAVTCGLGACEHTVDSCFEGTAQACDPLEGAAEEICNAVDDDCDGEVDDGLAPITCGVGPCEHTVESCVDGQSQTCDPLEGSSPEICDGVDNDCDGQPDQGLGETTCGQGICEHTVDNCHEGSPQFCDPFLGATPEQCNGLDDDCDGDVDEDQGQLTCGQGACAHTVESCLDGAAQSCDPLEGATDEVCDGVDNDCDGDT